MISNVSNPERLLRGARTAASDPMDMAFFSTTREEQMEDTPTHIDQEELSIKMSNLLSLGLSDEEVERPPQEDRSVL